MRFIAICDIYVCVSRHGVGRWYIGSRSIGFARHDHEWIRALFFDLGALSPTESMAMTAMMRLEIVVAVAVVRVVVVKRREHYRKAHQKVSMMREVPTSQVRWSVLTSISTHSIWKYAWIETKYNTARYDQPSVMSGKWGNAEPLWPSNTQTWPTEYMHTHTYTQNQINSIVSHDASECEWSLSFALMIKARIAYDKRTGDCSDDNIHASIAIHIAKRRALSCKTRNACFPYLLTRNTERDDQFFHHTRFKNQYKPLFHRDRSITHCLCCPMQSFLKSREKKIIVIPSIALHCTRTSMNEMHHRSFSHTRART